jgi:NADP-dependent alcohol dehydrogenase
MRVRREQKREKLLQYGRRVWGVTAKDENAAIDEAIARTEFFFESLGVPTRLSAYGIGEEAFDAIIAGLKEKGHTAMSERGDLTLEDSRNILKAAL